MAFLQYTPLILSAAAVMVSVLAWRKSRVIYEILNVADREGGLQRVNELLKTEKYTILHVYSNPSNSHRTIYILGRVSNQ